MDSLASVSDVYRILGPPDFGPEDDAQIELLIEEASDLVRAWTGKDFKRVPDGVRRVTARIVARTLSAGGGSSQIGMSSESQSAGPFSVNRSFEAGSTDGAVWLSRQDKIKLRRWKGGAYSIQTW